MSISRNKVIDRMTFSRYIALSHRILAISPLLALFVGIPNSVRSQSGSVVRSPVVNSGPISDGSALIAAGDLIDLEVFNTPELSALKLRVDHEGTITMPVAGNIVVAGLTPSQADRVIEDNLRAKQIMLNPSVTILVTDYAITGIDVLGEVKTPGIYSFLGPHSLYDVIAAAGGLSSTNGDTILVTPKNDALHPLLISVGTPEFTRLEKSTTLQPGDVVEVSRASFVYVVGDVVHSGQYTMGNGKALTALDALALAQGPNRTAKLSKASIVRKTASGPVAVSIDLTQVQRASLLDPYLQPDDILVVPHNGVKSFLDQTLPGVTAAVTAAVAYGYIHN